MLNTPSGRDLLPFAQQRGPVRGHELGKLHRGLAQQRGHGIRHGRFGLEARQVVQQQHNQDEARGQSLALFDPEKLLGTGRDIGDFPTQAGGELVGHLLKREPVLGREGVGLAEVPPTRLMSSTSMRVKRARPAGRKIRCRSTRSARSVVVKFCMK